MNLQLRQSIQLTPSQGLLTLRSAHSKPSKSTDRHHGSHMSHKSQSSLIIPTSFDFQSIQAKLNDATNTSRIHSKKAKRVVRGQVLGARWKKKTLKENKNNSEKQVNKHLCHVGCSSVPMMNNSKMLCITSVEKNRNSGNSECTQIQREEMPSEVYQIFKKVQRKLENDQILKKGTYQKQESYMSRLKQKIQRETRWIRPFTPFLIVQGESAEKYRKEHTHRRLHSARPYSTGDKLDLAENSSFKQYRPLSCRSKRSNKGIDRHSKQFFGFCSSKKQRNTAKDLSSSHQKAYIQRHISTVNQSSSRQDN